MLPNENLESIERVLSLKNAYPGYISIALGLHPEDVDAGYEAVLAAMRPLLDEHQPVAVGEIGIDLYWDATWRDQQMAALDTQLHWCKELGIPFIIHCRNALDEILWVLDNFDEPLPQGVFHSFTGTPQEVEQVRERGDFYFGVNGIVTFKKSNVKDILPVVGLDRLLLETDSPYLAPVPTSPVLSHRNWVLTLKKCHKPPIAMSSTFSNLHCNTLPHNEKHTHFTANTPAGRFLGCSS